MFRQSCFIRRNTNALQERLKELGYGIRQCCNFEGAVWLNTYISEKRNDVHGVGFEGEEIDLMGYDTIEKRIQFFLDENEKSVNKSIDCGTDDELFLAIAALRDDNDYMQWFVCDREYLTYEMKEHKVGDFVLFDGKKAKLSKVLPLWHKATVQELIEHFK
jgi:hypothetical protein